MKSNHSFLAYASLDKYPIIEYAICYSRKLEFYATHMFYILWGQRIIVRHLNFTDRIPPDLLNLLQLNSMLFLIEVVSEIIKQVGLITIWIIESQVEV